MFCTKCGQQVPDDSKICPFCGETFALGAPAPAAAPKANPIEAAKAKASSMDKKTLLTIAVAAAAAVVVLILLIVCLSGGPKKTVKAYLKASEALSEEEDNILNKYSWQGEKAQKALDLYEEPDSEVKTSWKISKVKKYGKKDDVTEGIKEYISQMKGDDEKITASAIVQVTTTTKEDGDKDTSDYFVSVLKIKGNWYILSQGSGENIKDIANKWEAYNK